ncbi:MAG: 50S ribosomal protein L2 [Candidatus Aenigmarchaeota archaeon]|nr:50S ribosomal protein L2 [Candidatus Aenigmarchaeota archaeon]
MGKRIISQRRGRGSPTYRANSHRYLTDAKYSAKDKKKVTDGVVVDIEHDPSRNAPVALVRFKNNDKRYMIASEGSSVGKAVQVGAGSKCDLGNVLPVGDILEGTPVFNIEIAPGDGGKLVRSSGMSAIVSSHSGGKTVVKLPSKRFKSFNSMCRATIGVVAGGERKIKPFGKASNKSFNRKARGKLYPITSKTAMNAVDHKFGGDNKGIPTTSSRNAPPGAKVGSIAARRTGKKR